MRTSKMWKCVAVVLTAGVILALIGLAAVGASIKTTTANGSAVNENHYEVGHPVYVVGDGFPAGQTLYVRVTSPNGDTVHFVVPAGIVSSADGSVGPLKIAVAAQVGVYKVWVSTDPAFKQGKNTKTDNFLVVAAADEASPSEEEDASGQDSPDEGGSSVDTPSVESDDSDEESGSDEAAEDGDTPSVESDDSDEESGSDEAAEDGDTPSVESGESDEETASNEPAEGCDTPSVESGDSDEQNSSGEAAEGGDAPSVESGDSDEQNSSGEAAEGGDTPSVESGESDEESASGEDGIPADTTPTDGGSAGGDESPDDGSASGGASLTDEGQEPSRPARGSAARAAAASAAAVPYVIAFGGGGGSMDASPVVEFQLLDPVSMEPVLVAAPVTLTVVLPGSPSTIVDVYAVPGDAATVSYRLDLSLAGLASGTYDLYLGLVAPQLVQVMSLTITQ